MSSRVDAYKRFQGERQRKWAASITAMLYSSGTRVLRTAIGAAVLWGAVLTYGGHHSYDVHQERQPDLPNVCRQPSIDGIALQNMPSLALLAQPLLCDSRWKVSRHPQHGAWTKPYMSEGNATLQSLLVVDVMRSLAHAASLQQNAFLSTHMQHI